MLHIHIYIYIYKYIWYFIFTLYTSEAKDNPPPLPYVLYKIY